MSDTQDLLLALEDEGRLAIRSRDPDACERIAAAAADLDPDHWLILMMTGAADIMDGHVPDAIAQWMAAVDRMEDVGDIDGLGRTVAPLIAESSLSWPYPAQMETAGLMALSDGMAELTGGCGTGLMLSVLESLRGMVSDSDQGSNAQLMQSASEIAYTAVMFGTDMSGGVECARTLLSTSDAILDSMEGDRVPPEMDCMPIAELREHIGVRMEAYRLMVAEWDASAGRLEPQEMDEVRRYWAQRPQRCDAMKTDYMDIGFMYSRTRSERDLESLRKAARSLVLKWLRIRK